MRYRSSHLDFSTGLLCLLLCFVTVPTSFAQTVQANQADLARTEAGATYAPGAYPTGFVDDHAAPSPNDADLGEQEVFKPSARYQPFTASIAAPFYWTSNAALTRTDEKSDFIVAPVAAVAYQPRLTDGLYGVLSVREQLFYYDRFSNLNFGSFDVEAGLTYLLPQVHNLILRGEYLYERLTAKNTFHDFFSNHSFLFGAEVPFQLGRNQQLSLGVDANVSFAAEPDPPQRNDYELYLGYTVHFSRAFWLDTVGRVVLRDYHLTDRLDVSEVLGVTANYSITRFLTASAISSFAVSRSNHSVFDYEVASVGGLVSLSLKF